jgi:hypothetical protein
MWIKVIVQDPEKRVLKIDEVLVKVGVGLHKQQETNLVILHTRG